MDPSTQGPGAVHVQKEFRVRSLSKDPGTVHESRWVISVPHTAMRDVGGQMVERPYGVSHARQTGSALTACGRYAVGWRIFGELPFQTSASRLPGVCRSRRSVGPRKRPYAVLTLVTSVEDETHLRGTRTRYARRG